MSGARDAQEDASQAQPALAGQPGEPSTEGHLLAEAAKNRETLLLMVRSMLGEGGRVPVTVRLADPAAELTAGRVTMEAFMQDVLLLVLRREDARQQRTGSPWVSAIPLPREDLERRPEEGWAAYARDLCGQVRGHFWGTDFREPLEDLADADEEADG